MLPTRPIIMKRSAGPLDFGWLAGATVTRVYMEAHAAGLLLDRDPDHGIYDLRLGQPFRVRVGDRVLDVVPENPPSMVPFVALVGATVQGAQAGLDGTIRIELAAGSCLECDSDPHYEAWQLNGPAGYLVVSLPGGGLAAWSKE